MNKGNETCGNDNLFISNLKDGYRLSEWAVDDYCKFSTNGIVGKGTGTRVFEVIDNFGTVVCRMVLGGSDNTHEYIK